MSTTSDSANSTTMTPCSPSAGRFLGCIFIASVVDQDRGLAGHDEVAMTHQCPGEDGYAGLDADRHEVAALERHAGLGDVAGAALGLAGHVDGGEAHGDRRVVARRDEELARTLANGL